MTSRQVAVVWVVVGSFGLTIGQLPTDPSGVQSLFQNSPFNTFQGGTPQSPIQGLGILFVGFIGWVIAQLDLEETTSSEELIDKGKCGVTLTQRTIMAGAAFGAGNAYTSGVTNFTSIFLGDGCPMTWVKFENKCYKFTENNNYLFNVMECNRQEAEMTCITTASEWNFINNLVVSSLGTPGASIQVNYNDMVTEGTFECDSGEVPEAGVVDWATGNPGAGDQVVLYRGEYYTSDNNARALCERSAIKPCTSIGLD